MWAKAVKTVCWGWGWYWPSRITAISSRREHCSCGGGRVSSALQHPSSWTKTRTDIVTEAQVCKSTRLQGFQRIRLGHLPLIKSKGRESSGDKERKEFISVMLTLGRHILKSQRLPPKCWNDLLVYEANVGQRSVDVHGDSMVSSTIVLGSILHGLDGIKQSLSLEGLVSVLIPGCFAWRVLCLN